jgi:hypothetical protein
MNGSRTKLWLLKSEGGGRVAGVCRSSVSQSAPCQSHQLCETWIAMKRFKIRVRFHDKNHIHGQTMTASFKMPKSGLRLAGKGLDTNKVIHASAVVEFSGPRRLD